jgi:endonuclease/exonuclease/phosphatase family metal-dependent hydrolase
MRLLIYNIRYGAGVGKRFHWPIPYIGYLKFTNGHFAKIVDFIKSVNPDLVGLTEVDIGSYRVEKQNQAESIAAAIDHQAIYHSKYSAVSMVRRMPLLNKQGNAVLTSRQILATRFHYLRDGVKRLVIELEMQDMVFFLVHLSLKFRHRQYQLHELHQLVSQCSKPVIVAGDFNALWGDRELQLFLSACNLSSANTDRVGSYPSRAPRLQLDYIFHSPEIHSRAFAVPRLLLSDHAPLIWDFELKHPVATQDVSLSLVAPFGSRTTLLSDTHPAGPGRDGHLQPHT